MFWRLYHFSPVSAHQPTDGSQPFESLSNRMNWFVVFATGPNRRSQFFHLLASFSQLLATILRIPLFAGSSDLNSNDTAKLAVNVWRTWRVTT